MKSINCPLEKEKSYMRCINKNDLSYIDIPISRGQPVETYLFLLERADEFSGNWNRFTHMVFSKGGSFADEKEKKRYHYFAFFTVGIEENQGMNLVGRMKEGRVVYDLTVDRETLKIIRKKFAAHLLKQIKFKITNKNLY